MDQNSIHGEVKGRLKLENACCHSVMNLLSSNLLSKNIKTEIYRTIILLLILYGCENWSLTLREECRLRVFERDEVTGEWRRLHKKELSEMRRECSTYGGGESCI